MDIKFVYFQKKQKKTKKIMKFQRSVFVRLKGLHFITSNSNSDSIQNKNIIMYSLIRHDEKKILALLSLP